MMNDQFQPPHTPETSPMPQLSYEQAPVNPEKYAAVKSMEQRIEVFRTDADASDLPRATIRQQIAHLGMQTVSMPSKEKPLRAKLIEVEAEIGGKLLSPAEPDGSKNKLLKFLFKDLKKQDDETVRKFWYDHDDWFYAEIKGGTYTSARYQLINGRLDKSVAGLSVAIDATEQDSFLTWTAAYYEKVRTELYHRHQASDLDEELEYLLTAPNIKKALVKDDFDLAA